MKNLSLSIVLPGALMAIAASAQAQSSVTLFGVLDVAARAVKNGDGQTLKSLTSDGLNSSRLGFRGTEDLGSGWSAGFWLEAGLAPDLGTAGTTPTNGTGTSGAMQGTKFFSRRSTMSVVGPWGEVRLGRDFLPSYWNLSTFHVYGGVGLGNLINMIGSGGALNAQGALGSNAGTLVRIDNAINYFLPTNLGGVYGQVTVAAGEGTNTSNGNNSYRGGRLGWTNGKFDTAAAFARTKVPGSSDFEVWNAGASYQFPVGKVMAVYDHASFTPSGLPRRTQRVYALSGTVPVGLAEIRAAIQRSATSGGRAVDAGLRSGDAANEYVVGGIYNLSKRTAIYADVGRIKNQGLSALTIPGGITTGSNLGALPDRSSTGAALGLRHFF